MDINYKIIFYFDTRLKITKMSTNRNVQCTYHCLRDFQVTILDYYFVQNNVCKYKMRFFQREV